MPRSTPAGSLATALLLAVLAIIVTELCLRLHPTGFAGGLTDDQRYLDAALDWFAHGPQPGETHWALRHPLILSIVAAFKLVGVGTQALLLVPRVFHALLVGVSVVALTRYAGVAAALLWTVLIAVSPVMHEMATSCFPEMVELALSALSLWCFHAGRQAGARSRLWFVVAGIAAGTAFLTRETAAVLVMVYGLAFVFGPGGARSHYLWLGAGWLAPVVVDWAWLWAQTGDPLYRYHVDAGHIHIASAHLKGGVYTGTRGPILNFDLAARWVPSGPLPIHWTVDPVINLIIDPEFGLIFLAWIVLALTATKGADAYRRLRPALLLLAVLSFVLTTWVLMLRPQPRYYLLATYAATIAVALLGSAALRDRTRRRLAIAVIGVLALAGVAVVSLLHRNQQLPADLILPYLREHPGRYYVSDKIARRIAFPLGRDGLGGRVTDAPVPIGGVRLRVLNDKAFRMNRPIGAAGYVPVDIVTRPRPWAHRLVQKPTAARRPALVVERRVG